MNLIGRYLRREIMSAVVFVLVGFLALFAFFDFIKELEEVGRAGYKLQHALLYVTLATPSHAYELMPIAALIGTIYALAQFASHSEFTAMRAAGLGRGMALKIIAQVGVILAIVTLLTGEVLTPPAEKLAQRVRLSALGASVVNQFRSGLWIKDTLKDADGQVLRTRFVNVQEVLPDTSLKGVRVFEFDPKLRLSEVIVSESGQFRPPGSWQLDGVQRTEITSTQAAESMMSIRASHASLAQHIWQSELNPNILGVLMVVPQRMSAWDLARYVEHLRDNQQRADRYEIALWTKLVYPLAVIVMMTLALPFGYLQVRAGSIGYKVFAGIMLGIAFHFLNGLFSHLGLLNTWPAWLSAGIPSLIALFLALGLLAWVDRAR